MTATQIAMGIFGMAIAAGCIGILIIVVAFAVQEFVEARKVKKERSEK